MRRNGENLGNSTIKERRRRWLRILYKMENHLPHIKRNKMPEKLKLLALTHGFLRIWGGVWTYTQASWPLS
jgi:hypothetical protein